MKTTDLPEHSPLVRRGVTRRGFLQAGGGAAAAAALLPVRGLGAGGGTGAWSPRLALSSVMFSGLTLDACCRQAADMGFKGIDLWGPFGQCRHLLEAQELGAAGWRQMLENHGLEVACYTTYRTKGHDEGFPAYAEFIGACGGGLVVRESRYGQFAGEELEAALRKFFEDLRPEIELARKHQVRLAIENHSGAILDTLASLRLFLRLNPAPEVVGIALAPYHLQARKVPVEEAIRACGKQLWFLYAWQLGSGTAQLPGHGPTNFGPWLEVLAEQDYGHWMTPFMHGELPAAEMAAAVAKAKHELLREPASAAP